MSAPFISIIVPVYKVENYLAECLDSILNQTFRDFEVICVNDCSPDGSAKILADYARKDSRIKIVEHEQNQGLSAARNTGVVHASGEYIYYIDSDDAIVENTLEILEEHIRASYADIIVFGIQDMVFSPNDVWFDSVSSPHSAWHSPFTPDALFHEQGAYPFVWRNIYRRNMLVRNKLSFPHDLRYGEDVVYQMMVFPHAHRILFIPDKLYLYRRLRKDSLTRTLIDNTAALVKKHVVMLKIVHDYWEKAGFIDKYGKDLYCWMLNFVVPDFRRIPAADQIECARDLLQYMTYIDSFAYYMNEADMALFNTLKDASAGNPQAASDK